MFVFVVVTGLRGGCNKTGPFCSCTVEADADAEAEADAVCCVLKVVILVVLEIREGGPIKVGPEVSLVMLVGGTAAKIIIGMLCLLSVVLCCYVSVMLLLVACCCFVGLLFLLCFTVNATS